MLGCWLRVIGNVIFHASLTGWSSLTMRRMQHWFLLMYKAILGKLSLYICVRFAPVCDSHNLRSSAWIRVQLPAVRTEAGKRSLFYDGPWSWNDLQSRLKLRALVSIACFKLKLSEVLTTSCSCSNK